MTTTALEGRIANILNEREVTITLGSRDGVRQGMAFEIKNEDVTKVIDPETQEPLGELDRAKARVRVSEVRERFSVARTYETYQVRGFLGSLDMGPLFKPAQTVTKVRTLKVGDSQLPAELLPDESFVKVGDRVVQIIDDGDET